MCIRRMMRSLLSVARGKHLLEICGTVSLHELLFGSQEDVGFKPGHRETELSRGIIIVRFRIVRADRHVCLYIH